MKNKYYQKHKERLQKEARENRQNLSEEEKEKRCNKKLSEEKKQKLVDYRRNYYETHKIKNNFLDA